MLATHGRAEGPLHDVPTRAKQPKTVARGGQGRHALWGQAKEALEASAVLEESAHEATRGTWRRGRGIPPVGGAAQCSSWPKDGYAADAGLDRVLLQDPPSQLLNDLRRRVREGHRGHRTRARLQRRLGMRVACGAGRVRDGRRKKLGLVVFHPFHGLRDALRRPGRRAVQRQHSGADHGKRLAPRPKLSPKAARLGGRQDGGTARRRLVGAQVDGGPHVLRGPMAAAAIDVQPSRRGGCPKGMHGPLAISTKGHRWRDLVAAPCAAAPRPATQRKCLCAPQQRQCCTQLLPANVDHAAIRLMLLERPRDEADPRVLSACDHRYGRRRSASGVYKLFLKPALHDQRLQEWKGPGSGRQVPHGKTLRMQSVLVDAQS
mmetsp:Transcript_108326/g.305423  ORF Transcript_108326/g.305423 Transcript_108326/m.305423 type:complete len:376 (+) Transcript_108326:316-1443(+)